MAVKIGLVGTGTVGGGCIDIIQKHKDDFLRHFGVDIELARVCSLSPAEAEAHGVGHLFTDNFNNIINDPEIDIVVELIGGTTIARTVVLNALAAVSYTHLVPKTPATPSGSRPSKVPVAIFAM